MPASEKINCKKNRERAILNGFLTLSPFQNGFRIIEGEEPDFLLEFGKETVGIELVDYVRGQKKNGGSPLREAEVFADRVIEGARKAYSIIYGWPFLNVSFYPFERIKHLVGKNSEDNLSEKLAEVINRYSAGNLHESLEIDWNDLEKAGVGHIFSNISVSNHDDYMADHFWHRNGFAWPMVGEEEIVSLITKKERLLPTYLKKSSRCFLLIVSEGPYPSSMAITSNIQEIPFKTNFDRIFIYEYSHGYVELKKK